MTVNNIIDRIRATPENGAGIRILDLSRPYQRGMPQSPNHPAYYHALARRHGDSVRADGTSGASDVVVMGTHVGTHIDALSHVSHDGILFGGSDAQADQNGGSFEALGVHTIDPFVCNGILLDIPAALGINRCEPGYEITANDLDLACERQSVRIAPGDVVLIRSGWGQLWDIGDAYIGHVSGVPGVGAAGAQWLADRQVRAAGADSIAFEQLASGQGHSLLPAHRVLIVENGIYLIETMNLEEISMQEIYEFVFVCSPLRLVGATGSPVRPLAVVSR